MYKFRDDMRLTFENCRVFNTTAGDWVRKLGDSTSDTFEAQWAEQGVEAAWKAEVRWHELQMQHMRERVEGVDAGEEDTAGADVQESPIFPKSF